MKYFYWLLLVLVLPIAGCDNSHVESLQQENKTLKSQVDDLQKQLQEKELEIQTLREPDKITYEKIEQEWMQLGGVLIDQSIKTEAITALIQKYFEFTIKHPNSSFVANANQRIESLKNVIKLQNSIVEKQKEFLEVPEADLDDLCNHPEQYYGKEIRVKGILSQGVTGQCYFGNATIRLYAKLSEKSESPFLPDQTSVVSIFLISVGPDEKQNPCVTILDKQPFLDEKP
jgi:hypothetical protein